MDDPIVWLMIGGLFGGSLFAGIAGIIEDSLPAQLRPVLWGTVGAVVLLYFLGAILLCIDTPR